MATESTENRTQLPDVTRIAERLKERIYADLTIIAVTLGLAMSGSATHLPVALTVIGASLGLWLATIAAEEQAHRIAHGRLMNTAELRHTLFVTSPLMTAGVGPVVLVGLSALDVLTLTTALYISVAVDTVGLFVWGCISGKRMGANAWLSVLSGLVNLLIGGIVIAVKLTAGH